MKSKDSENQNGRYVEYHNGHKKITPRKEARNLLMMLGSAFLIAFICIILLVRCYGASGTRILGNLLIAPTYLKNLKQSKKDTHAYFISHKMEFIQRDRFGKNWSRYSVSLQSYEIFYKKMKDEHSLPKPDETEMKLFEKNAPSTLIFVFDATKDSRMVIQEIQFLEDSDLFRVRLGNERFPEWVYFRSPGIFDLVIKTFTAVEARAEK